MPEGSKDAAVLIAASWQALNRALGGNKATQLTDCTIVILFAGFFIEANLNYIIEELGERKSMEEFLSMRHPGLQDKLGWFYNRHVAKAKAANRKQLYARGIAGKLRRRFPGFATLHRFRNDLSHGVLNKTAFSIQSTVNLRVQAKAIVDQLFEIAEATAAVVQRDTTYHEAISPSLD